MTSSSLQASLWERQLSREERQRWNKSLVLFMRLCKSEPSPMPALSLGPLHGPLGRRIHTMGNSPSRCEVQNMQPPMWIQGLQPPAWGEVTPACQDGEDRCRAVFLTCLCVRPPGGCVNCRLRAVGLGGPESCISNRVPAMLLLHGHTWGGSLQSPPYLGPTLWGEVRVRALPVRRG